MEFSVIVLGSSSAIPTAERGLTAQLVVHGGEWMLLDCGEGTQIQMRRFRLNFNRISRIFISHLHADHFLGLPGLLSTMSLLGRQKPLEIYGPADLKPFLEYFERISSSSLKFPWFFVPIPMGEKSLLASTSHFEVWSFPLRHKVPVVGFLIQEKQRPRKIKKSWLEAVRPTLEELQTIKQGADYIDSAGRLHRYEDITEEPLPPRSYAYCTDTAPLEILPQYVREPSLLYHEATFTEEHANRAQETLHSTAAQAAQAALACGARRLLIGHFSVRYPSLENIANEARAIFPKVVLAKDGERYKVE